MCFSDLSAGVAEALGMADRIIINAIDINENVFILFIFYKSCPTKTLPPERDAGDGSAETHVPDRFV
jgi:hypothetical protein